MEAAGSFETSVDFCQHIVSRNIQPAFNPWSSGV